MSISWKTLLRPHIKTLALGLLAVIGETITDLLQPWTLKIVFDNVLKSHPRLGQGWVNAWVVRVAGQDQLAILRFAAIAALVIAIVGAASSYAEKYLTTSVGQWVMHDLRRIMYSHVQRLSLSYHDQKETGDLISRLTSDIDAIQSFITSGLLSTFVNTLTLVGMVAVMFLINWRFTLVALSVAPLLLFVVYHYTLRIKKASREVRKKEGAILSVMQEVLTSIRVVKAFGREDYEQRRLEEESLESVEMALRARALKAKLSPIVEIIVALGTSMVLWFGSRMVLQGSLTAGSLVVFILYLGKMYNPMQELSKMTDAYSKASIGFERIKDVLATDRAVDDLPRARTLRQVRGEVEFRNVSFHYDPQSPILHNVSFRAAPGQMVAFVGPTGAGKSTIVSLIPRFYDPIEGVVLIDGQDIRRFTQKSIRQHISFVLQETLLFHGSIWNNIAYGKPEASRAEIYNAAEAANAAEFIDKMPQGYDTIVGERGVTLSGGQRQRIAIARAVIRKSPILILDEPTSGLDASSEKLVFEALDRLMEGKTSIVIAHRLSTIRRADTILFLGEGTIREYGTHDTLMQSNGRYAKLYEASFEAETSVKDQ